MDDCWILQLLLLTISSTLQMADSLSGEHVCTRVENRTLTFRETYLEPVIVQTFTWCLQVPPRCSKSRVENRERYRIKSTVVEKKITECCEGYVLEELYDDDQRDGEKVKAEAVCVPFCKLCGKNGLCLEPNVCQCKPGYRGDNCTHECPTGSWGDGCMQKCDCALGESCNPVNGICECPAGWEGVGCKLPCSKGRWGPRCELICDCGGDDTRSCHPVTGNCDIAKNEDAEIKAFRDSRPFEISPPTTAASGSREINEETETSVPTTHHDNPWITRLKDFSATRFSRTTKPPEDESLQNISQAPNELGILNPELAVSNSAEFKSTEISKESTQPDEIIGQTVPETRRTIPPRLPDEIYYRNVDNEGESGSKMEDESLHPSYVKTVQKEQQVPQIPYDTTVLIVVGSVVSLCITTLAALMVFYLKSKVFESIPLSIYSNDKNEGGNEKGNSIRSFNITNTTLPPLPTFVNPVFAANPENALITFDAAELNKHYDNRTGTISIRVSRNMRDLLESHYDRPPAATCRHTVEQSAEHVYDEIPLTAPLCVRKET